MCIRDRLSNAANSVPDKSKLTKVSVLTANDKMNGGKKTLKPEADARLRPIKAASIVVSIPMIVVTH